MGTIAQRPFLFENIDDASADLILQLQLSDIQEFKLTRKGKQREGSANDHEVATHLLEEDLDSLRTLLADRRMTKSIAQAVRTDGLILGRNAVEEEEAREDHALAHQLTGNNIDSGENFQRETMDDAILAKLAGLYVSEELGLELAIGHVQLGEDGAADGEPETSAWAASRKDTYGDNLNRFCEACREPKKYFDVITTPCRHEYCRACLRELFIASLTDESLFPPRCCRQSIPLSAVSIFLTSGLKEEFLQKKVEFSTPNRTYCSRPNCSSFIPTEDIIDEIASCPSCLTRTCAICKAASHEGQDCPSDTALQATMGLARENGWQRCYSCRRLVELDLGCNHITCRCGSQFCYICGAHWKTCTCPQWNEDRLLARANQVVQRDAPRLPPDNRDRIERVQEAAEMLRERHNCAHLSWRYTPGPHRCEECYFHLPRYIFECQQCRIRVCNRCKSNRL